MYFDVCVIKVVGPKLNYTKTSRRGLMLSFKKRECALPSKASPSFGPLVRV